MTSTNRRITIATSAAATALVLAACSFSGSEPLKHGTVKKKTYTAAYTTPIYRDIYRKTNCRTVTTNALTLTSISLTSKGGSRGRSTTGGGGGVSKVKPAQPNRPNNSNKFGKGNNSGGSSGGKGSSGAPRKVCDREFVRRDLIGTQPHPAVWKVKITDGDRSAWKRVSGAKWHKIKVGDKI